MTAYTVVNHMLLPKAYRRSVEEDYWHLREAVQLWDVSCQRQVEISGPDAARLAQWMTPRNLGMAEVGQCMYVALTNDRGGMVNDPVLLKLGADRFWLSVADADVLLWALGLAVGAGINACVREPDVSPLSIQGPRAADLLARVFGERVREIRRFRFEWVEFGDALHPLARTGYSSQDGFELFLCGADHGGALWDALWEAGGNLDVAPGCPNLIDRIEAGLLSYGNDMTSLDTPLECGLARFCALDGGFDFLGRESLRALRRRGVDRRIRGVRFEGPPCATCVSHWPVHSAAPGGACVGRITSAAWSPRHCANVGLAMIARDHWNPGTAVSIAAPDGERDGVVVVPPI